MTIETKQILGVPVAPLTMAQAVALADRVIAQRGRLLIGVVNAAKIVNMRRDAALRDSVLSADVILADGMAVVWASRLLNKPLPERVAGIDLMMELLARGNERGYRVFLLGAEQGVLDEVVARIRSMFPGVVVAGSQHGYYGMAEEEAVANAIASARADVLLVAMTSPKKEQFLARFTDLVNVPVCHGVGGAFDVFAGKVKRAPALWQKLGCEWLYRVLQEPGRLWKRYFVTNCAFIGLVAREWCASWFAVSDDRRRAENASSAARTTLKSPT